MNLTVSPIEPPPDRELAAAPVVPRRSILLLGFAAFVSAGTARVGDPLLPSIGHAFSVTTGEAAAVMAAFSIAYGLLQAFYGPIGDSLGKYRMVALTALLSSVGVGACALADSLEALAAARLLSGATAAAIIPLSMAWIGDVVPYQQRQPVLARFLSGQILGVVLGQAGGGVLSEIMGWRQVFVVLALLYLVAAVGLGLELLRPGHRRSVPGTGGALAGMRQMFGLLRRPWPATVVATVFLEGAVVFGAYAYVGAELQHRFGVGPGAAGIILAAFGIGGLAYAFSARRLVARLGEGGLARLGTAGLGVALLAIALAPALWLAPLATVLCGLSFYMFHNTLQTNATQMAPEARGSAVSLFAAAFFLGQTAGVAVIGPFFDRHGGVPPLIVAAIMIPLLGLWFAARLKRRPL
ncbi:MFS transporter [Chelatococcus reniformis]|nr:MFS transporter [Chelatococcus reniformis]